MNDPVLYVIDRQTKQKRLIRLNRFKENPKEMHLYFDEIPGEKPFQNPVGDKSRPVVINTTTGEGEIADIAAKVQLQKQEEAKKAAQAAADAVPSEDPENVPDEDPENTPEDTSNPPENDEVGQDGEEIVESGSEEAPTINPAGTDGQLKTVPRKTLEGMDYNTLRSLAKDLGYTITPQMGIKTAGLIELLSGEKQLSDFEPKE